MGHKGGAKIPAAAKKETKKRLTKVAGGKNY